MADPMLVQTYNFLVTLTESGGEGAFTDGAFSEVSGLQIEVDLKELYEGGRNDGVIQRIGRGKYSQKIVLKRGMFVTSPGREHAALWQWLQDVIAGVRPVRRYDGTIDVLDGEHNVAATWRFRRGLPARIVGPTLNAKSGEIALEELQIAHEGLFLEGTT
jgi:phage tail-like protein